MRFQVIEKVLPDNARVFVVVANGQFDAVNELEADILAVTLNEAMTRIIGRRNVNRAKLINILRALNKWR